MEGKRLLGLHFMVTKVEAARINLLLDRRQDGHSRRAFQRVV